jgi:hypothetical protein
VRLRKAKQNDAKTQIFPRVRAWLRPGSWVNTLLVTLLWPFLLICVVYLAVFFLLNSSQAPKILHAQLSALLKGDYHVESIRTDPFLRRLYLENVTLSEAGASDYAIFAGEVEAKIPLFELFDLISMSTLTIGKIEARNADVILDFRRGELNLLKIVLPYKTSPPSDEPSDFVINLSDLNVTNAKVTLLFDGFSLQLDKIRVRSFSLRAGALLEMQLAPKGKNGASNFFVGEGGVEFNPAMFGFPLAFFGNPNEGLVFSAASGSAAKIGQAYALSAVALEEIMRNDDAYWQLPHAVPAELRGSFKTSIGQINVGGFRWNDNAFEVTDVVGQVSGGRFKLASGWMNVGPKDEAERLAAAKQFNFEPSSVPAQKAVLWAAKLDFTLPVEDPVMHYFFGTLIQGATNLELSAQLAGDLNRVDGDLSLDLGELEVQGLALDKTSLKAKMAGQNLRIERLETITELGPIFASGLYKIMDGDFDIDLFTGVIPEQELPEEFLSLLSDGLVPLELLPDGTIKKFAGRLITQLNVSQEDGTLAVTAPKGLDWQFDSTIAGKQYIKVGAYQSGKEQRLITLKNNILRSPAGIRIDLGGDNVILKPGFMLNLDDMRNFKAEGSAHIDDVHAYTSTFLDIDELFAGPIDLQFNAEAKPNRIDGDFKLNAANIQYQNYIVDTLDVDLELRNSKLRTKQFDIVSDFAQIDAEVQSDLRDPKTGKIITDLMAIPLDAKLRLKSLDFEKVPHELVPSLGLKGRAGAELRIQGTIPKLKLDFDYNMEEVEILGEKIPLAKLNANFRDKLVQVPELNLWLSDPEQNAEADLNIRDLSYDLKTNVVSFATTLKPVSVTQFAIVQKLELPVKAMTSFDLEARVDLDAITTPESALSASYLRGEFVLSDVEYDGLRLGNSNIMFSHANMFTLIKGKIADQFPLRGYVRSSPKLTASVSLNFPDFEVLAYLKKIGLDLSDLTERFQLTSAKVSASLGFCYTGEQESRVSLIMDQLDADVFGQTLHLGQTAHVHFDLAKRELLLRSLEFVYGESVLKASGSADAAGNMSLDLNGEVDAAIVRSFTDVVRDSSGLFAISLSAKGKYLQQSKFSIRGIDISGFVGVRNPIRVLTSYADAPVVLDRGFVMLGKQSPCPKGVNCIYTPEGQSFKLGVQEQWLELAFKADENGEIEAELSGILHAALSQLVSKEIHTARGSLSTKIHAKGGILNKKGELDIDPAAFKIGGEIKVNEPISIGLRSLNDPIELSQGSILITEARHCDYGLDCISIPRTQALQGKALGGNYTIFGEIWREAFIPKGGTMSISGNNLSYRMQDELSLSLSPDIEIFIDNVRNFETYSISGNLDVLDARYKKNFDAGGSNVIRDQIVSMFIDSKRRVETYSPSFLRKMPQLGKINLNLNVNSENSMRVDVQIAGASIKLEVGTQINIGGSIRDPQPTGLLSFNSGRFRLRENDFEFQTGAQIAFNNSLNGRIDIVAQAEINTSANAFTSVLGSSDLDRRKRIQSSERGNNELYIVTLNVGGSVFAPQWSFDSSPYLTNANIYALVLTGKTIDEFSGNDVAMETLLSPLFSSQLDSLLNADQFKFVFAEGAAQFIYVKQINKGLRIAAGVSIRGAQGNEQAVSAMYYFNDNWSVDVTGQNTVDEAGKAPTFKLGARLRWHLPLDF